MRSRPSGITLVAVWFFISGLFDALNGAAIAFFMSAILGWMGLVASGFSALSMVFTLIGLLLIVTGVGKFVLGWGLFERRPWARQWGVIASVVSALGLLAPVVVLLAASGAVGLGGLFLGGLLIIIVPALIDLLAMFYLLGQEAVAWCQDGPTMPPPSTTAVPTAPPVAVVPVPVPVAVSTSNAPVQRMDDTRLLNPEVPVSAWLMPKSAQRGQRPYDLRLERNVIGRDSRCQIRLDDATVSGEHAAVVFENNRFILVDLASRNGTYLNGERIQRRMLYDGNEIRIGNTVLVFKQA